MLTNAAPNSALPTARELVSLTVPQLGMMLCHLAVSMTDLWVAGRLDASVQASLGIVSQVFTLLMLITSLAGSGCLTTISQALGAGLEQRARRYAALIAGLAGLTGTAIAATSLLCLPMTLRLMHVSPEMEPVVRTFIIAYSCQLPFYYTLIMLNSVFRAYKLVRLPLIAIAVVAVGNLIGSAGFGLGLCGLPDYGYQGIAWSTFGSALLGLACNLYAIVRHGILNRASLAPWRWARRAMPYLFQVGGPSALGALAGHMGNLVILSLLTGLPGDMVPVLAGMTLGSRVESFLTFPTAALSMTVTILSGHLIGGKQARSAVPFRPTARTRRRPCARIRRWAAVCVPGSGGGDAVHTARGRPAGRAVPRLRVRGHSAQDLFHACERGFRRGGGHARLLQSQLCDHVGAPASAGVDARQRLRRDRHLRRHALRERGFGILVRTALRREKMA